MSDDTALEAQIRADPSDVATHLVYADLLQGKGDPYGELIVLQHELAANPHAAALKKREQAWFARNYFEVPDYYQLTWQLGFVRTATIHVKVGYLRHAVEFLRSPAFKFLRTLRLRGSARGAFAIVDDLPVDVDDLVIETGEEIDAAHVATVVGHRPTLRRLSLATRRDFTGRLAIAAPALEELVLAAERYGSEIALAARTPALRSLVIHGARLSRATLAAILERRWPLVRLGLFVASMSGLHERVMAAPVWPHLEAFGIDPDLFWGDDARGRLAAALEQLGPRTIVTSPSWRSYAFHQLGVVLGEVGRVEDALRCLDEGLAVHPDHAEMWLERGNLCRRLGKDDAAVTSFERVLALEPHHAEAHHGLACHYRDANEPARGLAHIKVACKSHAPMFWHVRGQLERMLQHPGADRSLRKALHQYQRLDDSGEVLFQLACLHALLGDRRTALDTLVKALAFDPALKSRARTDSDLAALRDDPELARLTV